MAFVLVQHLAPDHKSILTDLIRRYTTNVIAHHGALDEGVHFIEKHFSLTLWPPRCGIQYWTANRIWKNYRWQYMLHYEWNSLFFKICFFT
jgi:hypothetical protein